MGKFKIHVKIRKFSFRSNSYDYLLCTGPKTHLETIGFLTKKEATKRGKKLACDLGIEFKEKIHKI